LPAIGAVQHCNRMIGDRQIGDRQIGDKERRRVLRSVKKWILGSCSKCADAQVQILSSRRPRGFSQVRYCENPLFVILPSCAGSSTPLIDPFTQLLESRSSGLFDHERPLHEAVKVDR
jgi:hypothetical protein